MRLVDKVKQTIQRFKMLKKDDRVIVAVSGGPDSVALLYILDSIKKEYSLYLHIAHLDHSLRKESTCDRLFVQGLAKKLRIPVTCEKVDRTFFKKKGSLEELARQVRYDFLFRLAQKFKATKIALGHTKDDQAETVLMRIIRGSGLCGLQGIIPLRKIKDFIIIRPLIEIERKEIERFLKAKLIKFRLDKSNKDLIYFRNRIRNKIIPFLQKEYNPNIKGILSNMAENIGLDYDYLLKVAEDVLEKVKVKAAKSRISLSLFRLSKFHPAIQRMVLRLVIERLKGSTRRFTYQHSKELEDLILNRPSGSIVDLPQEISFLKKMPYLYAYIRKIRKKSA